MRANTNIQTKTQKQLHLSDFRGVDYFTLPLDVQKNRATDMVNFIMENGRMKKRNGWEQVIKRLSGRINMIYPYKNEGATELLVYAGKQFYRITKASASDDYEVQAVVAPTGVTLTNQKCQAFAQGNVIYLVGCGKFLGYFKGEDGAYMIGAAEPYIPTTTIDINPEGTEEDSRSSLDPVNLLTSRRKNVLVGGPAGSTWKLDSRVDITVEVRVEVTVEEINEESGEIKETVTVLRNYAGMGPILYAVGEGTGEAKGRIEADGTLKLDFDTKSISRQNIVVNFFPLVKSSDIKRPLDQCRFGTVFGVGGAADRLFLSGNPEYKNVIWFSEADNFAYFPDQFTIACGTDEQELVALSNLNDNTLAAFKEQKNGEPSIYYITGEYRSTYAENGEVERIIPVFSRTAGTTNETAVNPYCVGNLEGDNLFLSRNGVFGIELQENVMINARIARQRSIAIDPVLIKKNLSIATAIVHNGKYFLSVNGECFVADALYRYNSKDSRSTQYEWWRWDNVAARVWAEVDGELWFGTFDGDICRFTEEYKDCNLDLGEAGDFTIDYERSAIAYNSSNHRPQINDRIVIRTDGVFDVFLKGEDVTYKDNRFFLKKGVMTFEDLFSVNGKESYFADQEAIYEAPYFIYDIRKEEEYEASFQIKAGTGVESGGFLSPGYAIVRKISFTDLYVARLETYTHESSDPNVGEIIIDEISLKERKDSQREIVFTERRVEKTPSNLDVAIYHSQPVAARWVTAVFDLGSNTVSKTLYKLTVSVDPESRGTLRFGFRTRFQDSERKLANAAPLDLSALDLNSFSFEPSFWSSYSVKVKVPRFNYIQFWFEHESEENCSIHDFTANYSIISRNLGVR